MNFRFSFVFQYLRIKCTYCDLQKPFQIYLLSNVIQCISLCAEFPALPRRLLPSGQYIARLSENLSQAAGLRMHVFCRTPKHLQKPIKIRPTPPMPGTPRHRWDRITTPASIVKLFQANCNTFFWYGERKFAKNFKDSRQHSALSAVCMDVGWLSPSCGRTCTARVRG